jgi:hypothetical protein
MPDESGRLTSADIPIINNFIRRVSPDNCLTCPVTGSRVQINEWQISDRLCMLPVSGQQFKADLNSTAPVLSCRSPAGGIVFLDAIYIGLLKRAVTH